MNKIYENKIFAIIALSVVIANIIMMFVVVVPAVAISPEGFVSASEICPENNVLFQSYKCGSDQQYENVFVCCGTKENNNYFGAVFASTSSMLGYKFKNVSGGYFTVDAISQATYTYNGTTVYLCSNNMISYRIEANFPYAEFGVDDAYDFTPQNSVAVEFYEYVINGGQSSEESNGLLNYSLPAGNLAIITTKASYENIRLSTTMPLQSTVFSGNPWPNTTQRIGTYNNLPQSLNASSLGNVIEWQKTGDTTLFGNTHSAVYEPTIVSKFTYIVISNPYYYPANNMEDNQFTNGAINIQMDDVVSIEVRNLTASVNISTGEIENTQNGTSWTGEIDNDTGDITWTDNKGDNTIPDNGGNLSDPTITGFQSWLKGILTSIRDIFEPAHDAIQTLSGAVRNFASWMYALYIWLPSPILNLLTSAISLAIVIGVIKVFI